MFQAKLGILLIFLLMVTTQCTHKELFYRADRDLDPYVQRFVEEGKKRGVTIDVDKERVWVKFGSLDDDKAGKCRPYDDPGIILLNQKRWQSLDDIQKEALVFHELGHCILRRAHKNEMLSLGEYASLMDSKEDGHECSKNLYSESWRQYYLDELFDSKTTLPVWCAKENDYFTYATTLKYVVNIPGQNKETERTELPETAGDIVFDGTQDYQIEVEYKGLSDQQNSLDLWWKDLWFMISMESDAEPVRYKGLVKINRRAVKDCYKGYVDEVRFPLKLTIRKQKGFFYFFANQNLVHQMDVETLGEKIGISYATLREIIHIASLRAGEAGWNFKAAYL